MALVLPPPHKFKNLYIFHFVGVTSTGIRIMPHFKISANSSKIWSGKRAHTCTHARTHACMHAHTHVHKIHACTQVQHKGTAHVHNFTSHNLSTCPWFKMGKGHTHNTMNTRCAPHMHKHRHTIHTNAQHAHNTHVHTIHKYDTNTGTTQSTCTQHTRNEHKHASKGTCTHKHAHNTHKHTHKHSMIISYIYCHDAKYICVAKDINFLKYHTPINVPEFLVDCFRGTNS